MTTKQAYQPKVGDKVRVLVEVDLAVDAVDVKEPHFIHHVYYDGDVHLVQADDLEYEGQTSWLVESHQIEPWVASQPKVPQGHVLLRDPSIGDVEREYREVRREAKVGELIKIVDWDSINFDKCAYPKVVAIRSGGTGVDAVGSRKGDEIMQWVRHDQYLVLEPTDIVWIYEGDDVYTRYQLAEAGRVAQVGEKVVAIEPNIDVEVGDVMTVEANVSGRKYFIDRAGDRRFNGAFNRVRVLLPLTAESEVVAINRESAQPSAFTALLASTNADMARHLEQARAIGYREGFEEARETYTPTIAELERQFSIANGQLAKEIEINEPIRQAAMASGLSVSRVAQDIAHVVRTLNEPKEAKTLTAVDEAKPTRDEVVEMAKRDVAVRDAKYHVDRENGVVVCIRPGGAKGIARIAPGEVFNVHIGKAIALWRSYGVDVPEAYLNAPQPEKAQVGDVVVGDFDNIMTLTKLREDVNIPRLGTAFYVDGSDFYWCGEKQVRIIDDSRDGYEYDVAKGGAAA